MLKEIAVYIQGKTSSFTLGSNLLYGHLDESDPPRVSVVQELSPSPIDGWLADRIDKVITVASRGATYGHARDDAHEIFNALHINWGVELSGVTSGVSYLCEIIQAQAAPQYIGQDEKGRYLFTCTYVFKLQAMP